MMLFCLECGRSSIGKLSWIYRMSDMFNLVKQYNRAICFLLSMLILSFSIPASAENCSDAPASERDYSIINSGSGYALDVRGNSTDNGANITQWRYKANLNQQFHLTDLGNGYWSIKALHSNKAVDVAGQSEADGANILQWAYHGGNNQQWQLKRSAAGSYAVVSRHSGKAMSVANATLGGNVFQQSDQSSSNQLWYFNPVDNNCRASGVPDPTPAPSGDNIAPLATASTSYVSPWETLSAVNDNSDPSSSNDKSNGAYGNWNSPNTLQWVQYDWPQNYRLSSTEIYWFDDNHGVLTPTTAYFEYWDGNGWVNAGNLPLLKDSYNALSLDDIVTSRVRVSMLNTNKSTGILEWRILGVATEGTPSDDDSPPSDNVYQAVTNEYEFLGINTDNALYAESAHFRIYYGGDGLYGPDGNLGSHSEQQLNLTLDFLEGAYNYYVVERGFRSPGLPVNSTLQGPYKVNVYSVADLNAGGYQGFDQNAGLSFLIIHTGQMNNENVFIHEFGHAVTLAEQSWHHKINTGAWWETTAQWFAQTFQGSSQHAAVASQYGRSTNQSLLSPYTVIGRSYLSIIHAENRYQNWPFLIYLNSNPDGFSGLGGETVQNLMRQYQGEETPIHTLDRLISVSAQTVMAYYNARLAYMDIGHSPSQQSLFGVINDSGFRQQAYHNLELVGASIYRVIADRQPMYGGSNIIPLEVSGDGNVTIQITNLGNALPESDFTAIVAIRSTNSGAVRYQLLENGSGTLFVGSDEEATLVVTNTPTTLYTYNAFASQSDDPELRGLDYQVQITGAQPQD